MSCTGKDGKNMLETSGFKEGRSDDGKSIIFYVQPNVTQFP